MQYDIFISYSHKDNIDNISGLPDNGWVDNFHKGLDQYLTGYLGRAARIWRDGTKMRANYTLHEAVYQNLDETTILVPILSPSFLSSAWCPQELEYFHSRNSGKQGAGTYIFPVVKTEIDAVPAVIGDNLLNEFFIRDDFGDRREIDPLLGGDHRTKFFFKVSDLARDIAEFIKNLERNSAKSVSGNGNLHIKSVDDNSSNGAGKIEVDESLPTIYLAEPSPDLVELYNDIRRDLEQRKDLGQLKFNFLPFDLTPNPRKPPKAEVYMEKVRDDVEKARLVVQLIGKEHDGFPQRYDKSYLQIQTEVCAARDGSAGFDRLVWIPRNIKSDDDEEHQAFVDEIRKAGVSGDGLMQDSFEEFKSRIIEILENKPKIEPVAESSDSHSVYILCDKSDFDTVRDLENLLQDNNCIICSSRDYLEPALSGDPEYANVSEHHNDYLTRCDAVLIYWHNARLPWVRKNVLDLQGSKAIRKGRNFRAQAVLCDGNLDKDKTGFRSPPPPNLFKLEGYTNLREFFSTLNANAEV